MNIFPKRGVIGGALTAVALALILSFKTPDATGLATVNSNGNTTGGTTGNNTGSPAAGRGSAVSLPCRAGQWPRAAVNIGPSILPVREP